MSRAAVLSTQRVLRIAHGLTRCRETTDMLWTSGHRHHLQSMNSALVRCRQTNPSTRRCFSAYAGLTDRAPHKENQQFAVTGSLLDARKSGVDVPLAGQFLEVSATFGPDAVAAFAQYAGDDNPIHLDDDYARNGGPRSYDGCIVHGLMVAGLFSTAFGRSISGALYVSQSLRFEHPVRVGERVNARIEVERARVTSSKTEVLVRCSTVACLQDGTVAVSGQAQVLLPQSCDVRKL